MAQHAATLHSDCPLILFGNDDQNVLSTISQPSLVLRMVDLLELRGGDKVLELGAGSGWSAALMGRVVGEKGHVFSLEIIPGLAQTAAENIASLGIANVQILTGDGAQGWNDLAPYDRVVFTAGTFDLPHYFYKQLRDQGLLLVVIKTEGGGDHLFLLRKTEDHFESLWSAPCGFVQLKGSYQFEDLESNTPDKAIPTWSQLQNREISKRRFWWGAKGEPTQTWSAVGIRSFLAITEPAFRPDGLNRRKGRLRPELSRTVTEVKDLQRQAKNRLGFASVSSVSSCSKDLSPCPLWPPCAKSNWATGREGLLWIRVNWLAVLFRKGRQSGRSGRFLRSIPQTIYRLLAVI